MKKYLIINVIFVFFGCGTEQGDDRTYNYTIVNNSGVTLEIIPYLDGLKDINYKVTLKPNEKINKNFTDRPPYEGKFSMYSFLFPRFYKSNLTSIEITFNNAKKMIHQGCTKGNQCLNIYRDIFNPIFSDERIETYVVTPEDYQSAIDCGGNCN